VVVGGPFFGDLQWRLNSLPIRVLGGGGGLGLYSAIDASSYAFVCTFLDATRSYFERQWNKWCVLEF